MMTARLRAAFAWLDLTGLSTICGAVIVIWAANDISSTAGWLAFGAVCYFNGWCALLARSKGKT